MAHLPKALSQLSRLESASHDISFGTKMPGLVPEHTHTTDNYGVITEGCLFLTLDGEESAYRSGDWFHVPAGAPHIERFEEATSVIVFWVKTN